MCDVRTPPVPCAPEPATPRSNLRKLRERTWTIPIDLETVTETRLVAEALAGSQSAFERIVRRYQRPMITLILRVLGEKGDRGLAEDLAQEAFVKAFLKLSAFDTSRRLSSWLFRIAHNTAIDALRRSKVTFVQAQDPADPYPVPETGAALPADPVETAALGKALEGALAELRPEYRVAIMLRYEEGLAFEDVAHVLGVPEATARSYVHRARKQLSARLTEEGWQPGKP